jgi:glycerophosphoryl diester phosphodiesterase
VQDRGCMAVELDMALTADGVPVLYHDKTLQRMCELSGSVSSMTWAELEKVDISVTHPLR